MKKSYRKVIFREIKQSFSRFLAIFFIVALGVGFFAGLMATTPDMRISADRYYDEIQMMDLRIVSTLGLTETDVQKVSQIQGVKGVMPSYSVDALMGTPADDSIVVRLHSLPEEALHSDHPNYLNQVIVTQGRLPENSGECVLEESKMGSNPVELGEKISLSEEGEDLSDTLAVEEFTVVGYVKSAYYLSIEREQSSIGNGQIDLILYTGENSFSSSVYTDLFVTVDGAENLTAFSSEYDDFVQQTADQLETLGESRVLERYQEVKQEAEQKLDEAKQEFENKKQETNQMLQEAQQELTEGKQQIDQSEKELEAGKQQLLSGEQTIADKEAQLHSAQQQLSQAEQSIQEKEAELQDGKRQLQQGESALAEQAQKLMQARQQYESGAMQLTEKEQQLQEGEAQWQAGQAQVEEGKKQLAVAKQQLDDAKQQIDQTKQMIQFLYALGLVDQAQALEQQLAPKEVLYEKGVLEYQEQEASLQQAEKELEKTRTELEEGSLQLQEAKKQLETSRIPLERGEAQLQEAQKTLDQSRSQLQDGQKQLVEAKNQLAVSRTQITEGQQQLAAAKMELENSRKKLTEGTTQLASAKGDWTQGDRDFQKGKQEAQVKLADAEQQIADAESDVQALEVPDWYVLNRNTNVGYASFDSNAKKIEAIASVFPVFFFLVAALVALTTMTRMIEEERTQIGTLKALGYSKSAIALKYIIYAGIATLAGSAFGLLVGFQVFPTVIWGAYEIMYTLPPLITQFNVLYAVISSFAAICCTMIATFFACYSVLAEAPSRLMLPRAPKAGKRVWLEFITPIWSHMKFTHKVTARNLIRYKKRFFMTVIGIAGCTALLLTGFGLRDSISDIVNKQFNDLYQYNLVVNLKNNGNLQKDPELWDLVNDNHRIADYLTVHQEASTLIASDGTKNDSAYLYVPQDPTRLSEFIKLRDRKSGSAIAFSEDTVLVTEKLAETMGIRAGSTITVENSDGIRAQLTVGGIIENYVYGYLYLSPSLYTSSFGVSPDYTQMIAKVPDVSQENRDALSTALLQSSQVSAAQFTTDLSESFSDIIKNIDYVVVVLIVCAGLLAFIVLYNLTNINITERQREIATIKVLGFYDKEVSAYIYRETAILTLIGTAVGLLLGIALHAFVVKTSEVDMVMFGRSIKLMSYIFSAVLTILFSLLVNLVMYRKLKKISMVESMKSGE